MRNTHTHYQESQRQAIVGKMAGLMKELQTLAPHPDCPDHNGPLFIKSNPNFKVANDHDGMLGSMMMESLLGTAFSEAVSETAGSWTQDFDAAQALECYSEYITDIEGNTKRAAAHGQGSLARMAGQSISGAFNARSSMSEAMMAFMDDMPKRMVIERTLAQYAKQLELLDAPKTAPHYAQTATPRLAA